MRCAALRRVVRANASSHPSFAGGTGARLPRAPGYWKTTIPVPGATDDGGGGPFVLIVPPSATPEPLITSVWWYFVYGNPTDLLASGFTIAAHGPTDVPPTLQCANSRPY